MGQAKRVRARHPNWIITTAAHSPHAIAKAARLELDAVLISPVFFSQSPSAGRPLGPTRVARWVRATRLPVIALGGIGHKNARLLSGTGVWGCAAIDGLRTWRRSLGERAARDLAVRYSDWSEKSRPAPRHRQPARRARAGNRHQPECLLAACHG